MRRQVYSPVQRAAYVNLDAACAVRSLAYSHFHTRVFTHIHRNVACSVRSSGRRRGKAVGRGQILKPGVAHCSGNQQIAQYGYIGDNFKVIGDRPVVFQHASKLEPASLAIYRALNAIQDRQTIYCIHGLCKAGGVRVDSRIVRGRPGRPGPVRVVNKYVGLVRVGCIIPQLVELRRHIV